MVPARGGAQVKPVARPVASGGTESSNRNGQEFRLSRPGSAKQVLHRRIHSTVRQHLPLFAALANRRPRCSVRILELS